MLIVLLSFWRPVWESLWRPVLQSYKYNNFFGIYEDSAEAPLQYQVDPVCTPEGLLLYGLPIFLRLVHHRPFSCTKWPVGCCGGGASAKSGHGSWRAQPAGFPAVFLMCHIRSKNGLLCTFSSSSVTSGNHPSALHSPLWHIPVFLMCHIRSKNSLPRGFPSPSDTSGNHQPAIHSHLCHIPVFLMCHIRCKYCLQHTFSALSITSGNHHPV